MFIEYQKKFIIFFCLFHLYINMQFIIKFLLLILYKNSLNYYLIFSRIL